MTQTLADLSAEEWEALCDGCGKCCLHKLIDEETGELSHTNVVCRLLDPETCRCIHYENRTDYVPDCVTLTPDNLQGLDWMPTTCAYRLLNEGRDLPPWHPLVSGDPESVHAGGHSVRGKVISEKDAGPLSHHVVDWWDQ